MNRFILPLLLWIGSTFLSPAQQRLRLMEWNVENLFDTIRTPDKNDGEFTPEGARHWNTMRYRSKLTKLSRTIAAAGGRTPLDLVALIEVENDSVLKDLTQQTKLWRLGYEYITTSSADERGINVALLYQPTRFAPFSVDTLRVRPPSKGLATTRDVLHVAGRLNTGDTLDVLIVHLPSRRNGRPATAYRRLIARRLKTFCDSLQSTRQTPSIILTGDFNAFYPEACFTKDLRASLTIPSPVPDGLYILSEGLKAEGEIKGTYKYQGRWNRLDQILVNGRLIRPSDKESPQGIYTSKECCRIGAFPWLLERGKSDGTPQPNRTYLGPVYHGGYSDHLPLILDLYY